MSPKRSGREPGKKQDFSLELLKETSFQKTACWDNLGNSRFSASQYQNLGVRSGLADPETWPLMLDELQRKENEVSMIPGNGSSH